MPPSRWSSTGPRDAATASTASSSRTSMRFRAKRSRAFTAYSKRWRHSMAIRTVLRMGDPRLLLEARPVERFDTPELHALIADMQDTMRALNGAGLAAPQIGVDQRV